MKKLLLLVSAVALLSGIAQAQNPIPKGTKNLNAGFRTWCLLGTRLLEWISASDTTYQLASKPHFRIDADHYSMGFAGNCNYRFNRILNIPRNFDFYAGGSINAVAYKYDHDYVDRETGLFPGIQVGGHTSLPKLWH